MGKVCSVAIICSPQAAAVTANFSQQVSGGGRPVSNMQYDLQPSSRNGILESNLDAFQIWMVYESTHIDTTHPLNLQSRFLEAYFSNSTGPHMDHSSSNKLEHMADVLKCEWKFHCNGHFHLVGIWLVQLTRWWCYITLTSNDHHIAPC